MSPANTIRIAHVGCGHWGKNIARNLNDLGVLAHVADASLEAAKLQADKLGVSVKTFDDLLVDPTIDALTFATPAPIHAQQVIAALKAGKHTYIEKPMALSLEDAQAMIETAAAKGRILMVGHLLQYHPAFITLKEQVATGLVGELEYIYSNRLSMGQFRSDENTFWSFAPHDISMMLGLSGERPSVVTAQGMCSATPGIHDVVTAQIAFPSGLKGHFYISWMHPFKEQRLVVIGSKGAIVFEDSAATAGDKLKFYPHTLDNSGARPVATKGEVRPVPYPAEEPLKAECQHFIDCIQGGLTPKTDGSEGLGVLDVLLRVEKSLQTGEVS